MDMTPFRKVVEIGSNADVGRVYIKIEYATNPHAPGYKADGEIGNGRLSISGVEGPRANGNCKGSCGQIAMHMDDDYLAALNINRVWKRRYGTRARAEIRQLLNTWDRWHLNDMVAGSPRQMAYIRANPDKFKGARDYYANALAVLGEAGLNPDTEYLHNGEPYKYGHAWLREDVPADVLDWLRNLPDAEHEPAWV